MIYPSPNHQKNRLFQPSGDLNESGHPSSSTLTPPPSPAGPVGADDRSRFVALPGVRGGGNCISPLCRRGYRAPADVSRPNAAIEGDSYQLRRPACGGRAAGPTRSSAGRPPQRVSPRDSRPGIGGYRAVVTGSGQRPLLFLDVDGPLIPFGARSGQYPTYPSDLDPHATGSNPLLARVDPAHGPRLAALPCGLVWATTWAAEANECLSPRLGLPQLPVVDWPEPADFEEQDERNGLHWKTRALVDWAAGLPSPGSTTRSPTPTGNGCGLTT